MPLTQPKTMSAIRFWCSALPLKRIHALRRRLKWKSFNWNAKFAAAEKSVCINVLTVSKKLSEELRFLLLLFSTNCIQNVTKFNAKKGNLFFNHSRKKCPGNRLLKFKQTASGKKGCQNHSQKSGQCQNCRPQFLEYAVLFLD